MRAGQVQDGHPGQPMRRGQLAAIADRPAVDDHQYVAAIDERVGIGCRPGPAGQFVGE